MPRRVLDPLPDGGVYRLSEAAVRRILLRQGFLTPDSLLYSLIFGLGFGLLGHAPLWPLVFTYTFFTLVHIKSFRHLSQLKDHWRGFEIAVENDSVLVRRRGSLESMANRSEITKLLEMPGRGLWIHTSDRRKRIWAPSSLSGYEELKARLAMWATIERRGSAQLCTYLGIPAALAIYASVLLVRSPYVFFPLLGLAAFDLSRFARISIKAWKEHGWNWRRKIGPSGFVDPFWVPAIPLMLLIFVGVKLVWILF